MNDTSSKDAASIAAALGGAQAGTDGWFNCICPCCDGRLGIKNFASRIVVHCASYCPRDDILAELRKRNLIPDKTKDGSAIVMPYDVEGVPPLPDTTPPEDALHPIGTPFEHRPNPRYVYRDAEGRPLFVVERCEGTKRNGEPKKWFTPWTLWRRLDGVLEWRDEFPPAPRVLYRLDQLAARPDAPVLVCEGEKTAEAAQHKFSDYVVVTWQGGANVVAHADWSPMKGRKVIIWPDNDEPGRKAAKDIVRCSARAGAESIAIVRVPGEWPEGWDLADDPPKGVSVDDLKAMLANAVVVPKRPQIRVHPGELHIQIRMGEKVLADSEREIFQHSGRLVRPCSIECSAASVRDADGVIQKRKTTATVLERITNVYLRAVLSEIAEWLKWNSNAKCYLPCDVPDTCASGILASVGEWTVPTISGVITTPTLRPDGSIIRENGYDAATQFYHARDPHLKLPPIPERPTKEEALAALDLLKSLLEEFAFVDEVDRAVALSGFLTPILRPVMDVAPMHSIDAPTFGSGKSFLVDLTSAIATGARCPVITETLTKEELEKAIAATLIAGHRLISIDNINDTLGGNLISQAISQPVMLIRILGVSDQVRIENVISLFSTGCNLRVRDDLVRRTLRCSIDRNEEHPETHKYTRDPFAEIMADRGAYVAAILTIARAYIAAGRPKQKFAPLAGFGIWEEFVRAPLVWLGCADPVASMEKSFGDDPERATLADVLTELSLAFGHEAVRVRDIIEKANELVVEKDAEGETFRRYVNKGLRDALSGVCAEGGKLNSRMLGNYLAAKAGVIVDGMKLAKGQDRHEKIAKWKVEGEPPF